MTGSADVVLSHALMLVVDANVSSPSYSKAPPKSYPKQESVGASHREEAETYEEQDSRAWLGRKQRI